MLKNPCECHDGLCPGHVNAAKWCERSRTMTLYRIDMDDRDGTPMCDVCGADAMASGLFATEVAS